MQGCALSQSISEPDQHRVCFVTETYPPEINGVALTVARLVNGLAARGHLVSIVRPYQRVSDSSGAESSVTLVRGLPLPGYTGLQFGLPSGGFLKWLWTRQRPDVVYVATEGPLGWSAMRAARQMNIAALSGFHTNYHSYSRHYRLGCLQALVFRYLRHLHNGTAETLVPSIDLRDRLQALGFKNVGLLGRGVDSDLFRPQRRCEELRRSWGLTGRDLAVLYVGKIAPEKNLGLALEAFRAMRPTNSSTRFVLVGDGPLRAALQKQHPDLIFCGTQTGEQLARHYASGDIFLFPSETETFGNVTLEAMASGLAVVAYDYAAAKSHISHGETGLLVPYGDSKAFVDSATRLVRQSSLIRKLRIQARQYATSINWSYVVERFESLLNDVRAGIRTAEGTASVSRGMAIARTGRM
jgi:glycosyltransferase involved in cell wall biosynthesis